MNRTYYTDPFCTELRTTVTEVWPSDGKYRVILDDTIFYPTGGGQPNDLGTIAGVSVLDVFEKDGQVVHVIDQPLTAELVELKLDWDRRFPICSTTQASICSQLSLLIHMAGKQRDST